MWGQCQASITLRAVFLKLLVLRMRDSCLSVSLCLAAVAAILSACLLLPLIDHPPIPPTPPHHHFRKPEKWLSHVRLLRYHKGCDPVTLRSDLSDPSVILSLSLTENKNKSYHAPSRLKGESREPLYQCGALTIIYPHDLWFLRQGRLDTYNGEVTARRLSISRLACPYLLSSPSLPSLLLVCTT